MQSSTSTRKRNGILTEEQVVDLIRTRQGDRTLREYGEELDVSISHLSLIYSGARSPGMKIVKQLGLLKRRSDVSEYQYRRKKLTRQEVVDMIRERQDEKTQRDFAQEIGIGETYLSDIYSGASRPGKTVLNYFGIVLKKKIVNQYEASEN